MSRRRGDSGPLPLTSSLDALSHQLGQGESLGLGRLFARWDDIVGPAMAAHVRPLRFDRGVLVVTVDHPAWATQVRHLADDLLTRVAEVTGAPRPEHLDVRVSR